LLPEFADGKTEYVIPVIPQEMGTTNPTNLTNQDAARAIHQESDFFPFSGHEAARQSAIEQLLQWFQYGLAPLA
jgi:hypothetical protein